MNHTRMSQTRMAAATLLLSLMAAGAAPAIAGATEGEAPPDAMGASEARTVDAEIIAADRGWSLDDTVAHLADQERFGELTLRLRERFPDRFSGAEFAAAPAGTSYVHFTGQVPPAAQAMAQESQLDVELAGGRKHTELQLRERSVDVVGFYASRGITDAGSAVLPNGRIAVTVNPGSSGDVPDLPPALRDGVDVEVVAKPVTDDFHTYGGRWIFDTTGGSCTTGFSVDDLFSSDTGITTAAHCNGMDSMVHDDAPSPSSAPFQDQHLGLFGDFEWHTALNHGEFANYYADVGELREVNSVESWGSINVNNTYCVYSRVNGTRTCDQVYSDFVNALTSSGFASSLIATDDLHATNGDSGGPWSYGTEAAGLVKGSQWIWFKTRSTWSVADLLPVGLGVVVMVQ